MSGTGYHRVRLDHWGKEQRAVVRGFEDLGWEFTVSSKGHAIGRSPDGVSTVAVGRNRGARALRNARASLKAAQDRTR